MGHHFFGIDDDLGKVVDMNDHGVWEFEVSSNRSRMRSKLLDFC